MIISIANPDGKKPGTCVEWLDVYVTLTRPPPHKLCGVLGKTFPWGDVWASSVTAQTASIVTTLA